MLLAAALAAGPARAQDSVIVPTDGGTDPTLSQQPAEPPSGNSAPSPSSETGGETAPVVVPTTTPADPPPSADDSGGADTTPPAQESDDRAIQKQPAHAGGDDRSTASSPAGLTSSSPPAAADQAKQPAVSQTATGNPGSWLGQDTFIVDKPDDRDGGSPGALRAPFSGFFVLAAASRDSRIEARERRSDAAAKISPLGGPPGSGNQLPSRNPFFNMLSGPGGVGAGLALASILAVLGAAFVLPRDRSRVFRTPTVTWRPLAYVPPIELPG